MRLLTTRRSLVLASAAAGLSSASRPLLAQTTGPSAPRTVLPSMTDGPFYPPRRWRERDPQASDWDADLTRVKRGAQTLVALGEHLALLLQVIDSNGRSIDGTEVEIWQCDARATYHHPSVRSAPQAMDIGFQGFGAGVADRDGKLRFRTIRPVPYPGRTPHIHVKLRHAAFGEWTSQLFVADEPGNAADFLWRSLSASAREAALMRLQPASGDVGLRWQVQQTLVLPA
jgi:protocatechuate 3,4-dioxygenase, beta subunit